MRLIDQHENQVGVVPTADAQRMAQDAGLDLVEVAPNARPPVCKILDYGKWRYQQQKKEDKSRASSRAGQLKEVKIKTVRIGDHDLMIKTERAKKFLEEGHKVQFTLQYRGREMAHQELGREIFDKVKKNLFMVSKVEQDMKMMGRRISMVLQPDHKDPTKVKPLGEDDPAPSRNTRAGASLNIPSRPPAGQALGQAVGQPAAQPAARPPAAPVPAGR